MEEISQSSNTQPHIAIIPTPGMGHLIPLIELARKLVHLNFSITFLIPSYGNDGGDHGSNPLLSRLQTLPKTSVSHLSLSPPTSPFDTPVSEIREALRALSGSARLVALVVDLLGAPMLDLAQELGILPYMFFLSSAHSLCSAFTIQKLDKMYTCDFKDLPEPVRFFPGSVPVHGADFPDPVQDRGSEIYRIFVHGFLGNYHKAAGFLVNSFVGLEPKAFEYLMGDGRENDIPPVYPVGPVVRSGSGGEPDEMGSLGCMQWLDEQPSGSVLFVCFGSMGTLTHEQIEELALGLETSGVRFLWVLKSPNEKNDQPFSPSDQSKDDDPLGFLPKGFLERTKGLGLVVPFWAPQVRVLSHASIGGFLTHCGWNSILEGVAHGVPFIAWPLHAEQRLNSVLLSEDLRVGFRVRPDERGIIGREQIAGYVRRLVQGEEGKEFRDRMSALKNAAHKSLEEGGSSTRSLSEVAQIWRNHNV